MKDQKNPYPAYFASLLLCSFPTFCVRGEEAKSQLAIPKDWPKQLDTRKLYPSKCGFIYAAGNSAAAQANKLVEAALRKIQKSGAEAPKTGLVLVMDRNEKPPFCAEQLMTKLALKQNQNKDSQEQQKTLKSLAEGKKELEEMGLDMNLLLSIAPMPIEPNMLPGLVCGFPQNVDQQISWCVTIPTQDNMRYGLKKLLDAGMKKEKIGMAQRVAMFPLLVYAENKAISEMEKAKQDVLDELLAGKQISFTDKQKQDK